MTPKEVAHVDALSEELKVDVLGGEYQVWAGGTVVRVSKGSRVFDGVTVRQYSGVVERIVASGDGRRVFVDGRSDDWLVSVSQTKGQQPKLTVLPMPQFFAERCGWWKLFNNNCESAKWEFDPVTGTMSATGFRKGAKQPEFLKIPE